jgi:hypothetical protein
MKSHLFYTFLVIFIATAVVTLLGVTNVIEVRDGYLTGLVTAFLIELSGAVIAIFKSANFFAPDQTGITAEEELRASIRKLDSAFGYLQDRQRAQEVRMRSSLLALQNLAPTPRNDIMVLVSMIEQHKGVIPPDVTKEAIGTIADVLEANVRIGAVEKTALVTLCKSLPSELAGSAERLLEILKSKSA